MSTWPPQLLARGRSSTRRRVRLELEVLEDRVTPTITYHGGALLPHVEAQAVFLGSDWVSNGAVRQQARKLDAFVGTLVNSSYLDMLATAGYRVGRGTASPGGFDPLNLDHHTVLSEGMLQSDLQLAINARLVAPPSADRLYLIFVEPNIAVGMGNGSVSQNDFLGYHGAFGGHDLAGHAADVRYAVLPYPGGSINNLSAPNLSDFQSLTVVASHELAEAVTDPDVNYGALAWYDDTASAENGDMVNLECVLLNGYAVQRIADVHDQAMTPAGAASLQPVGFDLLTGGQLYEHTAAGWTFVRTNVASISSQGIGIDGLAMIDVVLTSGQAYEYHDGGSWVPLLSGVKAASAGQGVSYVVLTDGRLYEYRDDTGNWSGLLAKGIAAIDAGTDRTGVNQVATLTSTGVVATFDDATGSHVLCSDARAIDAGTGGAVGVLLKSGRAYQFNPATNGWVFLSDGVAQVALGTDPAGAIMVDLVLAGGAAREYRPGLGWINLYAGVGTVGEARGGLVDVVFTNGRAYQHSLIGWTPLTSGVRQQV